MDKTNRSVKQCVIISVFVIIIGLMFTAGCGNDDGKTCQKTEVQNPRGAKAQGPGYFAQHK